MFVGLQSAVMEPPDPLPPEPLPPAPLDDELELEEVVLPEPPLEDWGSSEQLAAASEAAKTRQPMLKKSPPDRPRSEL